jgi:hypothetical protein
MGQISVEAQLAKHRPHPVPDQQQPSRQPILAQLATVMSQPPVGRNHFTGNNLTR